MLEDLRFVLPAAAAPMQAEAPEGEGDDALLEALGYDPVGLDALIARTGIPAPLLQAQLPYLPPAQLRLASLLLSLHLLS